LENASNGFTHLKLILNHRLAARQLKNDVN
jgi:hypothetical protein